MHDDLLKSVLCASQDLLDPTKELRGGPDLHTIYGDRKTPFETNFGAIPNSWTNLHARGHYESVVEIAPAIWSF